MIFFPFLKGKNKKRFWQAGNMVTATQYFFKAGI